MKDAEDIKILVDPDATGIQGTCQQVNQALLEQVVASLTKHEEELAQALGYTVVVLEDTVPRNGE